ncbi:MAG: NADP-binding protein, partial [Promethearchaeota archaeon]
QGDYSTIAMILNLIPMIKSAGPGLVTMKDIPVPRNTERVYRT